MFNEQNGECFWCAQPMEMNPLKITIYGNFKENPLFASFEHLIPKSKGGTNLKGNFVLAHIDCNNKRERRKWPHDPIYGNKLEV